MFSRYPYSEDLLVTRIFEECIDPVREPDDSRWDEMVTRELTMRGYVVRK
jgi:hypothetical protein